VCRKLGYLPSKTRLSTVENSAIYRRKLGYPPSKTRLSTVARAVESCPSTARVARRIVRGLRERSERRLERRAKRVFRWMRSARVSGANDEHRKRLGRCEKHGSDRVVECLCNRSRDREMEALDALTVAERHILARFARSNRGRSDDSAPCGRRKTRFARLPSPRSLRSRGRREHVSPFQSAREVSVGTATERFTSSGPVRRTFSWRTERARAGRGERSERSRLSDPYPRECGAVRMSERGYVAERPRAARRHALLLRARSAATRERPEGFHRITSTAVAVTPFPASERPEGFQRPYE